MAIIRKVARHEHSGAWAYIEYSDENPSGTLRVLGGMEFPTREEAEDYSKGFALDSYEYVEPLVLKRERLNAEKARLEKRIEQIDSELLTNEA